MSIRPLVLSALSLVMSAGLLQAAPGRLIILDASRNIGEINPVTGVLTPLGVLAPTISSTAGLAFDCVNQKLYMTSTNTDSLYTVDLPSLTATLVGFYGDASVVMHGLEFDDSTGALYGGSAGNFYSISPTTGVATLIGGSGTGNSFLNLGYNRATDTLYATNSTSEALFTINRATGLGSYIGQLVNSTNPNALAYNKDNGGLYLVDNSARQMYLINTTTGEALKVADITQAGFTNPLGLAYVSDECAFPLVPNASAAVTPFAGFAGTMATISGAALPVASPASTGIVVRADLLALGGSATQILTSTSPTEFTYSFTVPAAQAAGTYVVALTVTDAQGRTGAGQVAVRVRAAAPAGYVAESEPNNSKATATPATIAAGGGVYGYSTGGATTLTGDTSIDVYRVKTAAAALGIYRHQLTITTTGTAGHTGSIRGLNQSAGVIGTTDTVVQTSSTTTTPARFNQWYGFGKQEEVYYRVTGGSTTTTEYLSTLATTAITPVTTTFNPPVGNVTIARAPGVTTAMDLLVYDATFTAVADFLAEGTAGTAASLTRAYSAGTYYIAVSNVNTADSRSQPADSAGRASPVLDFPNVVANSVTTAAPTMALVLTDSASNSVGIATPKVDPFEVVWVKFTVGPVAPTRCQPADIADDAGNPLPSAGPNNGVNEGDYNAFFNTFFSNQSVGSPADIASDDGTPLPPFGPAGLANNGVNEGDYNAFFNNFFNGCP
ncbi:hypothetical protein BH11PLA1_BH11PLA1_17500 [soil metagenome]